MEARYRTRRRIQFGRSEVKVSLLYCGDGRLSTPSLSVRLFVVTPPFPRDGGTACRQPN